MAIIKAGTYVFVEEPTITEAYNQSLNYKVHYLTAENVYATNTFNAILLSTTATWGGTITCSRAENITEYPVTRYVGNSKRWQSSPDDSSNFFATDTTKLRTIIIETDQTVADDFYTWFTANTALQPKLSIDLTTLPGWANLSTGNHTIKIKAKGTGYRESELSAGVTVSKAPSTVTLEAGTYKFVNSPAKQNIQQDIAFTSFNTNYIAIAMYESTNRIMYSSEEGPGIVYNGKWSKTAWQTITLSTDQQVSAEFYKWAITDGNLVKQVEPAAYTDCLTFTGESSEFTLKATNKEWDGTLQWSTDHNTWTTLTSTEEMQSVNKKLYLRGKGNTKFCQSGNYKGVRWQLSAKAGCSGNIQTLLDYENPPTSIPADYCYRNMFYDCTNLTSAPELPATTLTKYCYYNMFSSCTNLTTTPKLPATALASYCYEYMFSYCSNLTTASELLATTLKPYCYSSMFEGCTKLKVNTSSGNKIFTCPSDIPIMAVNNMFGSTGGSFTGEPTSGNTYYWTE